MGNVLSENYTSSDLTVDTSTDETIAQDVSTSAAGSNVGSIVASNSAIVSNITFDQSVDVSAQSVAAQVAAQSSSTTQDIVQDLTQSAVSTSQTYSLNPASTTASNILNDTVNSTSTINELVTQDISTSVTVANDFSVNASEDSLVDNITINQDAIGTAQSCATQTATQTAVQETDITETISQTAEATSVNSIAAIIMAIAACIAAFALCWLAFSLGMYFTAKEFFGRAIDAMGKSVPYFLGCCVVAIIVGCVWPFGWAKAYGAAPWPAVYENTYNMTMDGIDCAAFRDTVISLRNADAYGQFGTKGSDAPDLTCWGNYVNEISNNTYAGTCTCSKFTQWAYLDVVAAGIASTATDDDDDDDTTTLSDVAQDALTVLDDGLNVLDTVLTIDENVLSFIASPFTYFNDSQSTTDTQSTSSLDNLGVNSDCWDQAVDTTGYMSTGYCVNASDTEKCCRTTVDDDGEYLCYEDTAETCNARDDDYTYTWCGGNTTCMTTCCQGYCECTSDSDLDYTDISAYDASAYLTWKDQWMNGTGSDTTDVWFMNAVQPSNLTPNYNQWFQDYFEPAECDDSSATCDNTDPDNLCSLNTTFGCTKYMEDLDAGLLGEKRYAGVGIVCGVLILLIVVLMIWSYFKPGKLTGDAKEIHDLHKFCTAYDCSQSNVDECYQTLLRKYVSSPSKLKKLQTLYEPLKKFAAHKSCVDLEVNTPGITGGGGAADASADASADIVCPPGCAPIKTRWSRVVTWIRNIFGDVCIPIVVGALVLYVFLNVWYLMYDYDGDGCYVVWPLNTFCASDDTTAAECS